MYIDIIVKKFGLENYNKGFILMRHGVQISKEHLPKTLKDRSLMEKITYALAIESIMYTMLYARLDAAFSQSVTRRFHVNPSERD